MSLTTTPCSSVTTEGSRLMNSVSVILVPLLLAGAAFIFLKYLFRFYAWVYPEADTIYRRHLDRLVDQLDEQSLFHIGKSVIDRIKNRIDSQRSRPIIFGLKVVLVSVFLNVLVFVVTLVLTISSHFSDVAQGIRAILSTIENAGWGYFLLMNSMVGVLGTTFDLISLTVTLIIMEKARTVNTGKGLAGHLVIDVFLAVLSCAWAYVCFDIMHRAFREPILPTVAEFTWGFTGMYIGETPLDTLRVNPSMWYLIFASGASGALPSIAYLVVLTPILMLRIVPRIVQRCLSRIVFLIAVDEKPVFELLSYFVGALGAIGAAVVGVVAKGP